MFRRIIGIIMLLLGLVGLAISGAGIYFGRQAIDNAFGGIDSSLGLTSESLDTAVDSLELAKTTIGDVSTGLDTVEEAALNISKTITDTRPLLDQVSVVVAQDAPASIEAMQQAIPNIAAVASTIDQTLITLSNFQLDESLGFNILGEEIALPLSFDLGIEYNPTVPFDQTFSDLGASIEGLPEQLRSVEGNIQVTSANLAAISQSIEAISADIDTINTNVAAVAPLLDQYISIVNQINDSLKSARTQVLQQQNTVKTVLTFILVWWGLPQLALVMIGWDFLFGRRGATAAEIKADVMEDIQDDIEEMVDDAQENNDKPASDSASK